MTSQWDEWMERSRRHAWSNVTHKVVNKSTKHKIIRDIKHVYHKEEHNIKIITHFTKTNHKRKTWHFKNCTNNKWNLSAKPSLNNKLTTINNNQTVSVADLTQVIEVGGGHAVVPRLVVTNLFHPRKTQCVASLVLVTCNNLSSFDLLHQWSFRKTEKMGKLARNWFWVQALLQGPEYHPQKIFLDCICKIQQSSAFWPEMVHNTVHNAFLNTLATGTLFPCVPAAFQQCPFGVTCHVYWIHTEQRHQITEKQWHLWNEHTITSPHCRYSYFMWANILRKSGKCFAKVIYIYFNSQNTV